MIVRCVYTKIFCALMRDEDFPSGFSCSKLYDHEDCEQFKEVIDTGEEVIDTGECRFYSTEEITVYKEVDEVEIGPDFVSIGSLVIPLTTVNELSITYPSGDLQTVI